MYLMLTSQETDIRYIQALNERTRHGDAAMGSIAVLSRADELGGGRLSATVSINEAKSRLRNHPDLAGVCETVVPVAGVMGMGAMMLRQADFTILSSIAASPPEETK